MIRRRVARVTAAALGAFVLVGALLVVAPAAAAQSPTADELTDEHVRKAIDAIVAELYDRKRARHFWDPPRWDDQAHGSKYQTGGYTALAVLALLHAGESYQDPALHDAVEHLRTIELQGTYAVALRANVWAKLPPRFSPELVADVRWLLQGFSERAQGWDYQGRTNTRREDNSIRQYGALAMWEASKRGVKIDPRYWRALEDAFLDGQTDLGGWRYRDDVGEDDARGSMTAAGLTVLFIVQDLLHAKDAVKVGRRTAGPLDTAIEKGLSWLDRNYAPDVTVGKPDYYFFYYAYGIERVGLASGRRRFGDFDWYRAGAAEIIGRLCTWDERTGTMALRGPGNRLDTTVIRQLAFGLMFLSRGRVPVAVAKLELPDAAWNARPRDVANLAAGLTEATEGELNWQVVSIEEDPDTWLEAPMLYLAGHRPLPFMLGLDVDVAQHVRDARAARRERALGSSSATAAPPLPDVPVLRRLKRYLDRGGFLFAANEGSARGFAASVEEMGTLLYPEHEWRNLPPEHWAYTLHDPVDQRRPPLRGLSNGVRELIIVSPSTDFGAILQTRDRSAAGAAAWQTITNLYLYASELNRPRPRLAAHVYAPGAFGRTERSVDLVRAVHTGNWDPEPAAIEVLRTALAAERGIDLRVRDEPLARIDLLDPAPDLVTVVGTGTLELTDPDRQALRRYVERGGVVLFESAGGEGTFVREMERQTRGLFGAAPRSARRHPVITGAGLPDGADLARVDHRAYVIEVLGTRETSPRLRGVEVGGEMRVFYSREDLSHALLDQPCWGVYGYGPQSARKLMTNLVLYASERPAADAPTGADQR